MTTEQLIEKLRNPMFVYTMAMHESGQGAKTRRHNALKKIDDLILVYVIGNDDLRKVVANANVGSS